MRKLATSLALALFVALTANAQNMKIVGRDVDTDQFGATAKSHMVEAIWEDGIGCPTNSKTFIYNPVTGRGSASTYTDPACPTRDASGDVNQDGFLLVKSGPTGNFASAAGEVVNESGKFLTELGYDIRKGSHCGAGAPRFNVTLQDGSSYFVGCASPPPVVIVGDGWERRRWGSKADGLPVPAYDQKSGVLTTIPNNVKVKSINIIFDEGTDVGPGQAFLDNVDISGILIGKQNR